MSFIVFWATWIACMYFGGIIGVCFGWVPAVILATPFDYHRNY